MMARFPRLLLTLLTLAAIAREAAAVDLGKLQQNYVKQNYGMFLHFNMGSYNNKDWADPNLDPNLFNPASLNTDQWAATAKAAGMTYGVLTTKHVDGFALWDTNQSKYDVAGTSWYNTPGTANYHRDVVQSYADSFRKRGLGVGLYYSIWDRSNGIYSGGLSSSAATAYVESELHQLLTNYGQINVLWADAWGLAGGNSYVDFNHVYNYVKTISPNTLLLQNGSGTSNTDITGWERTMPSLGNTHPSEMCMPLRSDNNWFYITPGQDSYKSAFYVANQIQTANSRNATYLLDVPPDRNGLIPTDAVQRLQEIKTTLGSLPPLRAGNLALGKTTTQSSDYNSDLTANFAVDGDRTSSCHTAHGDYHPWWKVDLGAMTTIGEIDLYTRDDCLLRDIQIDILGADGTTVLYTSALLNPSSASPGSNPLAFTLDQSVKGQFVRVSRIPEAGYDASGSGDAYMLILTEVDVYAKAPEPGTQTLLATAGLAALAYVWRKRK